MQGFLGFFAGFAAVVVLCAFFVYRLGFDADAAPLTAVAGAMVWLSAFACLDRLPLGASLLFALAGAALLYMAVFRRSLRKNAVFFTPGMVLFLVGSLCLMVLLCIRQPIFTEWDEFSFWGIAPKIVKTTGHMYSVVESSLRARTFTPGLVAFGYFFQFFGEFAPWKVFCAYDVLFFAVYAAALRPFAKKGNRAGAAPMGLFCLLMPFLVTLYLRVIYVVTPYRSSLSDIPLGIMFAAGLVLYFGAEKKDLKTMLGAGLCFCGEALVKDMGFALGLVAAGLTAFDYFFIEDGLEPFLRLREKRFSMLGQKLAVCLGLMAAPVVAFLAWGRHMARFMGMSRLEIGGEAEMGAAEMLLTGLKELFSTSQSEKFVTVMANMRSAFFSADITLFGAGVQVVAVVVLLFLVAYVAGGKKQRKRTVALSVLSGLGFLAFYIFTAFTYVYVFKGSDGTGLVSYNRYIYPYYIGWLLVAAVAAADSLRPRENPAPRPVGCALLTFWGAGVLPMLFVLRAGAHRSMDIWGRRAVLWLAAWALLAVLAGCIALALGKKGKKLPVPGALGGRLTRLFCQGVCLVLAAFCLWRYASCVAPRLCVIDYPDSYEAGYRQRSAAIARDIASLPDDSVTFFVHQSDDGLYWFMACYDFYPKTLEYSYGGGSLRDPAVAPGGISMSPRELCAYMDSHGCDYVYLSEIDDIFEASYAALFTDRLEERKSDACRVYTAVRENGVTVGFAPLEGGGGA